MEATPAPVPGGEPPSRGFCHQCDIEVLPLELQDGNFQCPRCSELTVECPYDGFERWKGFWQVRLAGRPYEMGVEPSGATWMRVREVSDVASSRGSRLVWAPRDHGGFHMRADSIPSVGSKLYLRLEPGADAMAVRHEVAEGGVEEGVAERGDEYSSQAWRAEMFVPGGLPHLPLDFVTHVRRAFGALAEELNRPLQQEEPARMHVAMEELRQLTAPLLGALSTPAGPMIQPMLQMGFQLAAAASGENGAWGQTLPGGGTFLNWQELFRFANVDLGGTAAVGVPEARLRSWLETRRLRGDADVEADWVCPICFEDCADGLVSICQDAQGKTVHAFHRRCIENWLLRRDDCPTCRRSPVVGAWSPP